MLMEFGEGQRLPNFELDLNTCITSAKEAYNLILPLIRLLMVEYEKKLNNVEEDTKVSVEVPPKLLNFIQNMWDQVSNSQLQYKKELMEKIQEAARFSEGTLKNVNLILKTFQGTNVSNIDPRAE
jgi:hypothetical protein